MPSYSRFIRGEKGWLLSYKHRLRGIKTHYFFNPQILEGAIFNSSSHRKSPMNKQNISMVSKTTTQVSMKAEGTDALMRC